MNVMERHNAHGKNPLVDIYGFMGMMATVLEYCVFRQKLPQTFRTNQTGNPSNGTFLCVAER